ncbi:chymotrypsin inhibitor-like [Stegodyphus dumicola]|uniref:chymotrypsin inhibitor-like n=1 Tax=Stegodyphus dumicola TaxID=202533 RepID=UPI0015ABE106|nr:chymotrypsin inhibitor-like [Stegodyphus dumicola]
MRICILFSLITMSVAGPTCPINQHYESCGNACPSTCESLDKHPVICVAMCVPGCQCNQGYLMTERGLCVKPEDCP